MPPTPRTRHAGWPPALLVLPALLLSALLISGCAASDPPARSPLGDDDATPSAQGTPNALPTFTPSLEASASTTPGPPISPTSDADAEPEHIAGEAIARLAEWIGAPETEFRLTSIEALDWPDACLGIENPAIACAEVITPGYRVTLHHVAAPDSTYLVHASTSGRYAWAPSQGPTPRTIAAVDPVAGAVTLERLDSNEGRFGTLHRTVPGSLVEVPLHELQPGQRVSIGIAHPLEGAEVGLIVLLVPIAE